MINVIPNENRYTVVHQGRLLVQPDLSVPGDPAFIIDGKRVPYEELDAWYTERMNFLWRGQKFHLRRYADGLVESGYLGGDDGWARDNGLQGSGYDGWTCEVPESEIEAIEIEKYDQLARWDYRKTFGVKPSDDLFCYTRPATDQEWDRESPAQR